MGLRPINANENHPGNDATVPFTKNKGLTRDFRQSPAEGWDSSMPGPPVHPPRSCLRSRQFNRCARWLPCLQNVTKVQLPTMYLRNLDKRWRCDTVEDGPPWRLLRIRVPTRPRAR